MKKSWEVENFFIINLKTCIFVVNYFFTAKHCSIKTKELLLEDIFLVNIEKLSDKYKKEMLNPKEGVQTGTFNFKDIAVTRQRRRYEELRMLKRFFVTLMLLIVFLSAGLGYYLSDKARLKTQLSTQLSIASRYQVDIQGDLNWERLQLSMSEQAMAANTRPRRPWRFGR
mgnify:CR=1 FL=1